MPSMNSTLLIVEDDVCVRSSLAQVFTVLGYRVHCATDGIAALTQIEKEVPEIMLSDLNMPVMSGFELMAIVRARFPGVQVVAMSGSYGGSEVPSGVAADAFYQKGSGIPALLNAVKQQPNAVHRHAHEAVWSTGVTDRTRQNFVMASCPRCCNFPQMLNNHSHLSADAFCIFCNAPMHDPVSLCHRAPVSEQLRQAPYS